MGVQDLYPLLKRNCPESIVITSLTDLRGIRVAVDISIYLYTYVRSAGENRWVDMFIIFLCHLKRNGIKAVCIFDGPNPPEEKKKEQERRRAEAKKIVEKLKEERRLLKLLEKEYAPGKLTIGDGIRDELRGLWFRPADRPNFDDVFDVIQALNVSVERHRKQTLPITKDITELAKQIAKSLGLATMTAPGEAETLASILCVKGHVDAVMSEDTDVLAYGTPFLLSKLDLKTGTVNTVCHKQICQSLEFTKEQFTDLCIMLSCDYNERVPKYGHVRCLALMTEHGSIEAAEGYMKGNTDCLNYKRCRKLFSVDYHMHREKLRYKVPVNGPIDKKTLKGILNDNECRIDLKYIDDAWSPTKIVRPAGEAKMPPIAKKKPKQGKASDPNPEQDDSEASDECDHQFDGGKCLDCGELSMCELCDKNPWDTRCAECDSGRVCVECCGRCPVCEETICKVCQKGHEYGDYHRSHLESDEESSDDEPAPTESSQKAAQYIKSGKKNIKEVNCDLFDRPDTDSLAHCVSADFKMGAGIALLFRRKFGQVDELLALGKGVGDVAVLRDGDRYIYYLITKKEYSDKPTYVTLSACLDKMISHMKRHNVNKVSMPRIGCGLDRLSWENVFAILIDKFSHIDATVTVCCPADV